MMKILLYISKLIYVALIGLFLYRYLKAKKEDPTMKFGTNFWVFIQLWFSIITSFLGLYSLYSEENKLASWLFNLGGMLIVFLMFIRIIIAGKKKLMVGYKVIDAEAITGITVSSMSIVFETKEKKIKVIDYIRTVRDMAGYYRDRIARAQRKGSKKKGR